MLLQKTYSPIDGSLYLERPLSSPEQVNNALNMLAEQQLSWQHVSLVEKQGILKRFCELLAERKPQLAIELTWQMGRPLADSPKEIDGAIERATKMIQLAPDALTPHQLGPGASGAKRWIEHKPLGVVMVIAPWNYPFLTAINSIIPALLAGNTVLLRHSAQTPLVAERMVKLLLQAGLPEGVCQYLHLSHSATQQIVQSHRIQYVAFTGSVEAGYAIRDAMKTNFAPAAFELGGKDAAYVAEDCDLESTVASLVDGAFFNAGQSCCGVERIYVHQNCYDEFVGRYKELTEQYQLGNPTDLTTTLGPMVKTQAANLVREHARDAVANGAKQLIEHAKFKEAKVDSPYCAPHVLVDVNHNMRIMMEETFGPAVGIQKVTTDDEAVSLVNDSPYGLTASVWTNDLDRAVNIGGRLAVGTVFTNACDYLDPELAWTGVKQTGSGVSLSHLAFQRLTRPQSYYCRMK